MNAARLLEHININTKGLFIGHVKRKLAAHHPEWFGRLIAASRLDLSVCDVSPLFTHLLSDSEMFYLRSSEYIKQLASVELIDIIHTDIVHPELCVAYTTRHKINSNCLTDLLLVNCAYDSLKRFISFQKKWHLPPPPRPPTPPPYEMINTILRGKIQRQLVLFNLH